MFYYWVIPAKIAGTWNWSLHASTGEWQNQLFIDQEFQDVRGKVSLQGWQIRIREPRLKGDLLSFRVRYNIEGENVAMQFKGRVNNDTIKGSVEIQGGPWSGTKEWTANRIKN